MAVQVLTNASIVINGEDISDHCREVTINYEAEMQDDTAFGDTTRSNIGGLKNWSMSIVAHQDWAATELDSVLFPLVGTTFTVTVKKDSGSVSTSNPSFSGTGILQGYNPIAGAVGDLANTPITINCAGTLTRATA